MAVRFRAHCSNLDAAEAVVATMREEAEAEFNSKAAIGAAFAEVAWRIL
jgi:hypothetical protein